MRRNSEPRVEWPELGRSRDKLGSTASLASMGSQEDLRERRRSLRSSTPIRILGQQFDRTEQDPQLPMPFGGSKQNLFTNNRRNQSQMEVNNLINCKTRLRTYSDENVIFKKEIDNEFLRKDFKSPILNEKNSLVEAVSNMAHNLKLITNLTNSSTMKEINREVTPNDLPELTPLEEEEEKEKNVDNKENVPNHPAGFKNTISYLLNLAKRNEVEDSCQIENEEEDILSLENSLCQNPNYCNNQDISSSGAWGDESSLSDGSVHSLNYPILFEKNVNINVCSSDEDDPCDAENVFHKLLHLDQCSVGRRTRETSLTILDSMIESEYLKESEETDVDGEPGVNSDDNVNDHRDYNTICDSDELSEEKTDTSYSWYFNIKEEMTGDEEKEFWRGSVRDYTEKHYGEKNINMKSQAEPDVKIGQDGFNLILQRYYHFFESLSFPLLLLQLQRLIHNSVSNNFVKLMNNLSCVFFSVCMCVCACGHGQIKSV